MYGKITKGIAGFYYIHVPGHGIYECRARGIFRKEGIKPLVGDNVKLEVLDEPGKKGNLVEVLERGNELVRPAVANIDQAMIIFSIAKPAPSFNLLDRFLLLMEKQDIPCIICFNKEDLVTEKERKVVAEIYESCGYQVMFTSAAKGTGIENLIAALEGKTTSVAGPSGVGKSSLVNCLQKNVAMETGDISEKIDRGKHTTRHSELIAIQAGEAGTGTYIMDTPGFSSLSLDSFTPQEITACYREFQDYEGGCRFQGCSHVHEPDCRVRDAVLEGKISQIRYDNYVTLYQESKNKRRY